MQEIYLPITRFKGKTEGEKKKKKKKTNSFYIPKSFKDAPTQFK